MQICYEMYSRLEASKKDTTLYVFTDNTDRTSGSNLITVNSWYTGEFGQLGDLYYPYKTSAVIRGLDNAYPITTQRWCNLTHYGITGRWEDSDLILFRAFICNDFERIYYQLSKKNYNKIILPFGGLFDRKISKINETRCPKLYKELKIQFDQFVNKVNKL